MFSLASVVVCLLAGSLSDAKDPSPTDTITCLKCHDESLHNGRVLPDDLARSVHAKLDCTDCHASIDMTGLNTEARTPHGAKSPRVQCGECHSDETDDYVFHGRAKVGVDPDVPSCAECHGTHDIRASSDVESPVHPRNLPKKCEQCHADVNMLQQHDILRDEPIKLYSASVHGKATKTGLFMAATCADCHSGSGRDGHRSAHNIVSPSDPKSPTHHFNIPQTCGRCHEGTLEDYWDGIHGQLVRKSVKGAPVCTDCHGEHGILPVSDMRSPVSAARLAEATCARCHESELLGERFGIPTGRLKSYVDTYHGLKRKAGSVRVANCASCHGHHEILPHTDPKSSIHPDNLVNTCGSCHPGISNEMSTEPIHEGVAGRKNSWAYFFTVFYMWLIGITIGLMLLHNVAHWYRHVREITNKPSILRLTSNETAQHWVLMLSFIALVISGFSLRFSEAWWVHWLFGWGGGKGFVLRGLIHRAAAVIFMVWTVWHAMYLFSARGRRWFGDMLARPRDLRDIWNSSLYFLGRRPRPASFGRFSYMEKCEYWALLWGVVIMTVTGLLLWFDNYFITQWKLPKGILDVSLVIHYYEAWLAFLAILVWHIYGTVFSPTAYPMNPAWLTGKMPKAMYEHEHPEAPIEPETKAAEAVPSVATADKDGNGSVELLKVMSLPAKSVEPAAAKLPIKTAERSQ